MFRANFKHVKCYCNVFKRHNSTETIEKTIPIAFFMKVFGMTSFLLFFRNCFNFFSFPDLPYQPTLKIVQQLPDVYKGDHKDVESTHKTLLELQFTPNCIRERPEILRTSSLTLENRYKTLQECGSTNIDIMTLSKYVIIMNRSVTLLKGEY